MEQPREHCPVDLRQLLKTREGSSGDSRSLANRLAVSTISEGSERLGVVLP